MNSQSHRRVAICVPVGRYGVAKHHMRRNPWLGGPRAVGKDAKGLEERH